MQPSHSEAASTKSPPPPRDPSPLKLLVLPRVDLNLPAYDCVVFPSLRYHGAAMMTFQIIEGRDTGRVFHVRDRTEYGGHVTIGRTPVCTVFLYSPTVAKCHLQFFTQTHSWLECFDVRRGYLTLLNGRIPPRHFGLYGGDELQVGEFLLRFVVSDD